MSSPLPSAERLRLWSSQFASATRRELRNVFSVRAGLVLLGLALVPVILVLMSVLLGERIDSTRQSSRVLALFLEAYYLRGALYFACLWLCARLVRGQMVQHTLHYALLAPVRREVLLAGQFTGAVLGVITVFAGGVAACALLLFGRGGREGLLALASGPELRQVGSYMAALAFAAVAVSALCLLLSLLFRNPALPGLIFIGLEYWSSFLPGWLQHLTVSFYLKPLLPAVLPKRGFGALFAIVPEPVPMPTAVIGLAVFASVMLVASCLLFRRLEINYGVD